MGQPDPKQLRDAWATLFLDGKREPRGLVSVSLGKIGDGDPAETLNRLPVEALERYQAFTDPARKQEWLRGRSCLLEVEEELLSRGSQASHILCSLAHSGAWALAAGVASPPAAGEPVPSGVGVDLEPEDRAITGPAVERFASPEERSLGLSPVELWAIKEAGYKANPGAEGTVIPQYRVLSAGSAGLPGIAEGPGFPYTFSVIRSGGWVVAFARGPLRRPDDWNAGDSTGH